MDKKVTSDKYIIQCKLDGVSCLIINKDNKLKAYTRGNGKVGTDISHLIRYFIKDERLPDNIALRCEIIIKKETLIKNTNMLFQTQEVLYQELSTENKKI